MFISLSLHMRKPMLLRLYDKNIKFLLLPSFIVDPLSNRILMGHICRVSVSWRMRFRIHGYIAVPFYLNCVIVQAVRASRQPDQRSPLDEEWRHIQQGQAHQQQHGPERTCEYTQKSKTKREGRQCWLGKEGWWGELIFWGSCRFSPFFLLQLKPAAGRRTAGVIQVIPGMI